MFIRKVALKYLFARRGFVSLVTGFSVTGIMIGVAALIVVMAVMSGFREELVGKILGVTGHATISGPVLTLDTAKEKMPLLEKIKGVDSTAPYVLGQAMLVSRAQSSGAIIRGVDIENAPSLITENVSSGSWEDMNKPHHVAIGKAMAQSLGVRVGSQLDILSPQGTQTAFGFIPRMKRVKVAALFDVGMYQYDSGMLYMSLESAQKFFKLNNHISALEVRVDSPVNINKYKPKIQEIMGGLHSVNVWQDNNRQFFVALQVERVSMFIILTLIVLVAAFNIITGQMMMVSDKRADIAILRTMGATKNDILKIFFYNGFMIGAVGTGLGVLLAILITSNLQSIVGVIEMISGAQVFSGEVYYLDRLPSKLEMADVLGVTFMSLGLSLLASLYPAWQAARLHPVEVLRNE